MPNVRTLQRSFAGGEMSPEMFGRIDDVKYQTGAATMKNFVATPQGPAENRPGFAFVREVKDSTKKTRLIPFTYSTTQTMVIELSPGYIRFHTQGGTLMSGGVPYEIANPYAEADLFDIHYVQSADVMTLVHPNYAPRELKRLGATNWTLTSINFGAPIAAPTGVSATRYIPASSSTNADTYETMSYVVTAIASDDIGESVSSSVASVTNNIFVTGSTNTIAWSAVTGASRYRVYKLLGGLYGYIGSTTGTSIVDNNIAPDLSITPPNYDNEFVSSGNYPGAVSYFEQRRCFAGTTNEPQKIWMTKSGTESNLSYGLPIRDDDRIEFRVAAREANTIRHIVPLTQLLLLTGSAEWRVSSLNSDEITPTTISVRPQSYIGASNVQPVIINNALVYCSARGGHVRELGYNWQASGFITNDMSIRSAHLFDNYEISDMAFAKAPLQMIWFVSTSGMLLGLTYTPEQQVGAWHKHDTDGVFESVTVVAEGNEDRLYAVIRRTIGGVTKRYVERMASRHFDSIEDAFFVDSGATYDGTNTSATTVTVVDVTLPAALRNTATALYSFARNTISGLTWLEGKTVSILADGAVQPQEVVTSGAITIDRAASIIHIGLEYDSDLESLPLAMGIDNGMGQGRYKNVNKAWLRVYQSSGIFIGPDENNLIEAKQRTTEPYGTPPALKTEEIQIMLTPSWLDSGQVFIRQSDPLPLTIVGMTLEVAIGG